MLTFNAARDAGVKGDRLSVVSRARLMPTYTLREQMTVER